MKQLAPAYNTSQLVLNSAQAVQETVEQHQQTTMRYDPKTGEAADFDTGDSALWAHLLGNGARRDSNAGFDGYHSSDAGLVAGVDHLFTPEMLGGIAASGLRGSLGGIDSASAQSATQAGYQLTFYGTHRHGRAFIDGQLGAGWNQFGQNRGIAFLGETASASFDGLQYSAHALAGYDFPVGGMGGMVVTPLVGLGWLHARNGAYSETGAGAADLSVKGQALDGLTQELGVKTTWSFATEFGQFVPEVTAKWVHDYTHGPIASSGAIGGETFAVTVPRIAADGARIGAAATLERSDRLSFGVEYNGELRAGYRSDTGEIKARWQF
jgi:outer membrane autotransporter protein